MATRSPVPSSPPGATARSPPSPARWPARRCPGRPGDGHAEPLRQGPRPAARLAAAARRDRDGRPRAVDVAEVNGRVFVNNSSIGLYPRVVKHRDDMRERLGRNKWVAMLIAVVSIFRRFPLVRLRMVVNGETLAPHDPVRLRRQQPVRDRELNLGKRAPPRRRRTLRLLPQPRRPLGHDRAWPSAR